MARQKKGRNRGGKGRKAKSGASNNRRNPSKPPAAATPPLPDGVVPSSIISVGLDEEKRVAVPPQFGKTDPDGRTVQDVVSELPDKELKAAQDETAALFEGEVDHGRRPSEDQLKELARDFYAEKVFASLWHMTEEERNTKIHLVFTRLMHLDEAGLRAVVRAGTLYEYRDLSLGEIDNLPIFGSFKYLLPEEAVKVHEYMEKILGLMDNI